MSTKYNDSENNKSGKELEGKETQYSLEQVKPDMAKETAVYLNPAKRQGEYTVEDYYKIPDERRVELIDGAIYDMGAPLVVHQVIASSISHTLLDFVRRKKGECIVLFSPIDVQLDQDNKTMVQPDVLILCKKDLMIRRCIYGAPDFLVEILSPSTRRKDSVIKLNKYMNADVREYWMVDPDTRVVTVYDFEHDNYPIFYKESDAVPVHIYDGDVSVDMQELWAYVDEIGISDREEK